MGRFIHALPCSTEKKVVLKVLMNKGLWAVIIFVLCMFRHCLRTGLQSSSEINRFVSSGWALNKDHSAWRRPNSEAWSGRKDLSLWASDWGLLHWGDYLMHIDFPVNKLKWNTAWISKKGHALAWISCLRGTNRRAQLPSQSSTANLLL